MTQDAALQEAEYAYERIRAERDALIRKGYCVHGWLQENGDGTQTCLAGCGQTFPDFETAMNAEPWARERDVAVGAVREGALPILPFRRDRSEGG